MKPYMTISIDAVEGDAWFSMGCTEKKPLLYFLQLFDKDRKASIVLVTKIDKQWWEENNGRYYGKAAYDFLESEDEPSHNN